MSDKYYDVEDVELEELKRRQLEALMRKQEEERRRQEEMEREAQKQEILRRVMTLDARTRLSNVKLVRPELAKAVEDYIVNLALTGQLRNVIDEETLKQILYTIDSKTRRDYKIVIKEKR